MSEVIHIADMSDLDMQAAELWHYSRGEMTLDAVARAIGCSMWPVHLAIGKHLVLIREHIQRERELARTN